MHVFCVRLFPFLSQTQPTKLLLFPQAQAQQQQQQQLLVCLALVLSGLDPTSFWFFDTKPHQTLLAVAICPHSATRTPSTSHTHNQSHFQPTNPSAQQKSHCWGELASAFFFSFSFLEGKAKEAKRGREREREVPCVSAWPLILAVAVLSFINVICLLGWQQQTTNNQHTHTPAHTHKHTQRQFF